MAITRARNSRKRPTGTAIERVRTTVAAWAPGYVFTPDDLLACGTRAAVDQALTRLTRDGSVRRLARGLYDVPRVSARLGALTPTPEAVAEALARRGASRLQVAGARAANALGLSSQVPGRSVFITDGTARTRRFLGQTVELRRAVPRTLEGAGSTAGAVLQALRHLGQDLVTDAVVAHLASTLSPADKTALAGIAHAAPGWARPAVLAIAGGGPTANEPTDALASNAGRSHG